MDCIKGCGRQAVSKRWKMCGICWKEQEAGYVERPPEPAPVVLPPQQVELKQGKPRKSSNRQIPYKTGYTAQPYIYNKAPEEGTPYDWRTGKELSPNEASQKIRGIWQGSERGEPHWSIHELARRFNLKFNQVRTILGLTTDFSEHQRQGMDYTLRGPTNADSLPSNRKK